jgi:hypothetical protein
MSKKIKINLYNKDFASISFLNNKKNSYIAFFKLFPFLRKKVRTLNFFTDITISKSQYKKLNTLRNGGRAPAEFIDDSIGYRECNEKHYEQNNNKKYIDELDEEFLEEEFLDEEFINSLDDIPNIINSDGLDDLLNSLFDELEENKKDIDNKEK